MIEVDIGIVRTAKCSVGTVHVMGTKQRIVILKRKRMWREECEDQSNANVAKPLIAQSNPTCQDSVHLSYSRATLCKADAKCWYMDCGASDHMCSQLGQVRNLKPINISQSNTWRWLLSIWNGIGEVMIISSSIFTLKNVLYVLELGCSLLSGYRVMENRACIISIQNRMLLKAPLVEGMYRIISESTAFHSLRKRHTRVPDTQATFQVSQNSQPSTVPMDQLQSSQ